MRNPGRTLSSTLIPNPNQTPGRAQRDQPASLLCPKRPPGGRKQILTSALLPSTEEKPSNQRQEDQSHGDGRGNDGGLRTLAGGRYCQREGERGVRRAEGRRDEDRLHSPWGLVWNSKRRLKAP